MQAKKNIPFIISS